jgi:hypothetical protein
VVGGVLLSIRDRFFTRADYDHLVLNAFPETQGRLRTLTPALMWPKPMWTGKQVISTVILNILPADMPPLTLLGGRAKVAVKNWQVAGHREPAEDMSESTVVIRYGVVFVRARLFSSGAANSCAACSTKLSSVPRRSVWCTARTSCTVRELHVICCQRSRVCLPLFYK